MGNPIPSFPNYSSPSTASTSQVFRFQDASQDLRQGCCQVWQDCQGHHQGGQEEEEGQEEGGLRHLHLQGAQAGAPGHRCLLQGDVHHEQLRQRPLRGSPPRPASWPTTTRGPPSPPGRSRPPCASCCPGSWPSTPCPRAPRPSPSTPAPNKSLSM